MKSLTIALIGYGCVGKGLHSILQKTKHIKVNIKYFVVKDENKERDLPKSLFTYNWRVAVYDPEVDVIVELIDDANEAYKIALAAIKEGKHVVSANKHMIANHLEELITLQEKNNVSFLYEAAVAGSIPIIRNLEEYYDNELLSSVSGIVNGSTNYILTKIAAGLSLEQSKQVAFDNGFLETDARLDIEGYDAKFKLCILAQHAFGISLNPDEVLNIGINQLTDEDFYWAKQQGAKIKLVARIFKESDNKVVAGVFPELVFENDVLYHVDNEQNAVKLHGAFSDHQTLSGKGAGAYPTGSAVLSDITALTYQYRYEYKKRKQNKQGVLLNNIALVKVYFRYQESKQLDAIQFSSIEAWHVDEKQKYVVGNISIANLINAKQNQGLDGSSFILLSNQTTAESVVVGQQLEEVEV